VHRGPNGRNASGSEGSRWNRWWRVGHEIAVNRTRSCGTRGSGHSSPVARSRGCSSSPRAGAVPHGHWETGRGPVSGRACSTEAGPRRSTSSTSAMPALRPSTTPWWSEVRCISAVGSSSAFMGEDPRARSDDTAGVHVLERSGRWVDDCTDAAVDELVVGGGTQGVRRHVRPQRDDDDRAFRRSGRSTPEHADADRRSGRRVGDPNLRLPRRRGATAESSSRSPRRPDVKAVAPGAWCVRRRRP